MVEIGMMGGAELAQVAAFYQRAGYGGGVDADDVVLAATLDGRVVGAVRLCRESGVIVLRGMQVDAACQRQGIGRRLLAHTLPTLDQGRAYCLPYEHLVDFYGGVGFALAPPDALPDFLARRLAGYRAAGQRVLAMRRG